MNRCIVKAGLVWWLSWLAICVADGQSLASGHEPASPARDQAFWVIYGPKAVPAEGDDDSRQVVDIRVPQDTGGELYLRLFDPDCGGVLDDADGDFDTKIRFRLLGAGSQLDSSTLTEREGTALAWLELAASRLHDDRWTTLTGFTVDDGETTGEFARFRLMVEGLQGNDANLFAVAVSRSEKRNDPPPGLVLQSHQPTVRLPNPEARAELQFFVPPEVEALEIRGFDLVGARMTLDTAIREGLPLASSEQGEWGTATVELDAEERGRRAALVLRGGRESPNDATFQIRSLGQGATLDLAIDLPVGLRAANRRPRPHATALALADCRTVVFDGSASSDPDGDALAFLWDFGDGSRGRGQRVRHTYGQAGPFEAMLVLTDDSGQVTATAAHRFSVGVNQPPVAVAGADRVVARGESVALDASASVDHDGTVVRYHWDLGDGTRRTGAAVSHTYAESGHYRVTLRVEDDSDSPCNVGVDEVEVWVNSAPAVEIGPDRIGSPGESLSFEPLRVTDSDGEIASYEWQFGDGSTAAGWQVDHAFAAPGAYAVMLTVRDDAGVGNSRGQDRLTVMVNDPPVAEAGPTRRVAVGEALTLGGGDSFDRDGEIVEYLWDFGDGADGSGEQVSHAFDRPGRYQARLTVRDDSGSSSDRAQDTALVIVNQPPEAHAGDDRVVTASEVRFDGSGSRDADGEIVAYQWSFGDGGSSFEQAPTHIYRAPGTYAVELTVRDDSGTGSAERTDRLQVVVNQVPIADAGADRIAAPGESLAFDGSASVDSDGEIVRYLWDFGDGETASGPTASHSYERPGVYAVHLTVADETGQAAAVGYDQATVWVNRPPVADGGPDRFGAPGDEILLDGSGSYDPESGTLTFRWQVDDSEGENSTFRYRFPRPGTYLARLRVRDDSGARNALAEDQVTIRINHPPQASAGEDFFGCETTVDFDGSGSVDADGDPLTYLWNFGDGSPPAAGSRIRHTYGRGGTYPVVLTVDDGSGLSNRNASSALTVILNEPPIADAGADRTVCAGAPVLMSGSASRDPEGGLLRYLWDFGDGTTAEGLNPTKVYTAVGVHAVTLTVRDDSGLPCDTSIDTAILRVAESPVAEAGADQTVCRGAAVTFDGSASQDATDGVVNSFFWDFGDGTTGGGEMPVHVYDQPGEYRVALTITGDEVEECESTDSDDLTVSVLEGPIARIDGVSAAVPESPVDFAASATVGSAQAITSWYWQFGDGTEVEGKQVSHTFAAPGRYRVVLTVTTDAMSCGSATAESWVWVNAPPLARAGEDRLAAVGEVLIFDATPSSDADGTLVDYLWDFGDGDQASGAKVRHRYAKSGRYEVTLEVVDDAGLANSRGSTAVGVVVNGAPEPVIEAPANACVDGTVRFSALSSRDPDGEVVTYAWDFGDGAGLEGAEVHHTFARPGRYSVRLTLDDGLGLPNSRALGAHFLAVNRPPVPSFLPDRQVCPSDEVIFEGSASHDPDGEIIAHRWDLGDGAELTGARVVHAYQEAGRYQVTLEVEDDSQTACATAQRTSTVLVNAAPVARLQGPGRPIFIGGAHDAVVFDASASYDPDGDPLTYHWDFGDGRGGRGAWVRHAYLKSGNYTVKLRVSDGSGTSCGEDFEESRVEIESRVEGSDS